MSLPPLFPGGTSITRLRVYDTSAQDGLAGGTPHLHTVSTEGYIVLSGAGAIQTIDPSGFRETALRPGSVVWFTPGTLHRAVNHGGLEVLVVMSNAGLPEAGDAVMTFPDEILADADLYLRTAALPAPEADETALAHAARVRRDRGVEGFLRLQAAAQEGGQRFSVALEQLYTRAALLVEPRVAMWREIWSASAGRAADETEAALTALASADPHTLRTAALAERALEDGIERFGMCGRLRAYDLGL